MSWSWSNPTPSEADDAYRYYKSKYADAAEQKRNSERRESSYYSQRNSAKSQIGSLSKQKVNFEKRLKGIEKIIKMLEGNGGLFSANVPEVISKAQKKLSKADESYRGCIKVTGGTATASIENALAIKTVEGDANSAAALQAYKAERTRLQREISNLNTQITNMTSLVDSLNRKISACNSEQYSLQRSMNSYAYDMNHYKRYRY